MKNWKRLAVFAAAGLLALAAAACARSGAPKAEAAEMPRAEVKTEDAAKGAVVYFTKHVTGEALVRAYEAVGRPAEGKTLLKLSFETPGGPYLSPALLAPLREKVDGTFGDSNGFTPPRNTTAGHLAVAERHGFTAVGPVDILDADGETDLPVAGGKFLKFHRVGSHFNDYDSVISLVRFKAHHIRDYGGTLKNLSICLASTSGKANIHSAGADMLYYSPADMESQLASMADAAKAADDAKPGRWVYINVLTDFTPDDSCSGTAPQGEIGILASTDPVAVDQAAVDMTFGEAGSAARETWERTHNVRLLAYAEDIGLGSRKYRLVDIDE